MRMVDATRFRSGINYLVANGGRRDSRLWTGGVRLKLLWKGQTQRSLRVPNELDYLRPRATRSLCCSGERCFMMKLTLLTFAAGFISADAMELIVKPSRIATAIIDLFIFHLLEFDLRRADDRFQVCAHSVEQWDQIVFHEDAGDRKVAKKSTN